MNTQHKTMYTAIIIALTFSSTYAADTTNKGVVGPSPSDGVALPRLNLKNCCERQTLTKAAPDSTFVSPNLQVWYNSQNYGGNPHYTNFSNTNQSNKFFLHSFKLPEPIPGATCRITYAKLTITRPTNVVGQQTNESIGIVAGTTVIWSTPLSTLPLTYSYNVPPASLSSHYAPGAGDGYFSFYVQDDTAVKSASLTVEVCCDPPIEWPSNGDDNWTLVQCPTCGIPSFDVLSNVLNIPNVAIGTAKDNYGQANYQIMMHMNRDASFTLDKAQEIAPTD